MKMFGSKQMIQNINDKLAENIIEINEDNRTGSLSEEKTKNIYI